MNNMTGRALNRKELKIHDLLLRMSGAAGEAIEGALRCFEDLDTANARQLVENDHAIDTLQHEVEERCVVAIARFQPVAHDLRDLVSDIYVSVSLERIADHAANIAGIVQRMSSAARPEDREAISNMGHTSLSMLRDVMDAYERRDGQQARSIAAIDDQVDDARDVLTANLFETMKNDASMAESASYTLWVAHNIERICDQVTNIAERIVYMASGEVVELND